jgi:hypothetical protein
MEQETIFGITTFSDEVLLIFMEYVPSSSWKSVKLTCKRFRDISDEVHVPNGGFGDLMEDCARTGKSESIRKFARDDRFREEMDSFRLVVLASKHGHVSVLRVLMEEFGEETVNRNLMVPKMACRFNQPEVLEWYESEVERISDLYVRGRLDSTCVYFDADKTLRLFKESMVTCESSLPPYLTDVTCQTMADWSKEESWKENFCSSYRQYGRMWPEELNLTIKSMKHFFFDYSPVRGVFSPTINHEVDIDYAERREEFWRNNCQESMVLLLCELDRPKDLEDWLLPDASICPGELDGCLVKAIDYYSPRVLEMLLNASDFLSNEDLSCGYLLAWCRGYDRMRKSIGEVCLRKGLNPFLDSPALLIAAEHDRNDVMIYLTGETCRIPEVMAEIRSQAENGLLRELRLERLKREVGAKPRWEIDDAVMAVKYSAHHRDDAVNYSDDEIPELEAY